MDPHHHGPNLTLVCVNQDTCNVEVYGPYTDEPSANAAAEAWVKNHPGSGDWLLSVTWLRLPTRAYT